MQLFNTIKLHALLSFAVSHVHIPTHAQVTKAVDPCTRTEMEPWLCMCTNTKVRCLQTLHQSMCTSLMLCAKYGEEQVFTNKAVLRTRGTFEKHNFLVPDWEGQISYRKYRADLSSRAISGTIPPSEQHPSQHSACGARASA